jgi:hypothetical protein
MKAYKNRQIDYSKPVRVYRNLHKKCFSIKQGDKVVAHFDEELVLRECSLLVSRAGNKRAKVTKQRNVHAYVQGYIAPKSELDKYCHVTSPPLVSYNPFTHNKFRVSLIGLLSYEAEKAELVKFNDDGKVFAYYPTIDYTTQRKI